MARPDLTDDLEQGLEAWAAWFNDLKNGIVDAPLPLKEYADYASLPSAAAYDRCVAFTVDTNELWYSDGSAWRTVDHGHADASGSRMKLVKATTLLADLTVSATWTGAFPAGVVRLGVAGRVITAITASGGGVSMNVGDHGGADADAYAAAVSFAQNTTFADDATTNPVGHSTTAQNVVLAPDAGAFTAGGVRLVSFYLQATAPTS